MPPNVELASLQLPYPTITARAHVVVVGAGVFGASAAYLLARAGSRITLIDHDDVCRHASGRNPGNLNPLLASRRELVPLALESLRLHVAIAAELAATVAPYAIEPVRRVLLAFGDEDHAELDDAERIFAEHVGFSTARLDARALQAIDPRLSSAIEEGLLIEGNRSLDSCAFNRALIAGARKADAKVIRADVNGLDARGHVVSAVRSDAGSFACDAVVLATGPWVDETKHWLDLDLGVEPVKGEMLRMRLPPPNITHDLTHGMISLYRRGNDEAWVGVTRERAGFDESPTAEGRRALIEGASRIMPAI
ncbi:MAG: FAD-dependent oxidoreductase, partial [Betaproteobacteria bacterium]